MKRLTLSLLTFMMSLNAVIAQNEVDLQATTNANLQLPRIQVVPITDTRNDRQYELYIKLPEAYTSAARYPVIYYTDAMWHVEMLSGSAEFIMEEAILVGISWQKDSSVELKKERGPHVSRYRDYSIRESSNAAHQAKYQFGQAGKHLNFIRAEVIPYVENNYQAASNQRTYFGYSLGGEFGSYILLKQPDTFQNYILGSPSIRGEVPILTELNSEAPSELNANVFISYGSLEGEAGGEIDKFTTLLKGRNDHTLSLKKLVVEGTHQSAFPMTAVQSIHWLSSLNMNN